MYEALLHKINLYCTACDNEAVRELISNIDNWSYMHRVGNGELSDREQRNLVNGAFYKLCDTPKADKAREERWAKIKQINEKKTK